MKNIAETRTQKILVVGESINIVRSLNILS